MKTDFLAGLGIDEKAIPQIMAENGKDIERAKEKFADYDDLKTQLKTAQEKIASFGDVEAIKAEVEKYKTEAETAKAESEKKVKQLELRWQVKEFTSGKKFVNELTKEALEQKLFDALSGEDAKGKNLSDLFGEFTKDVKNVLVDENAPQPPKVPDMAGTSKTGLTGVEAAFQKLNPTLKLD